MGFILSVTGITTPSTSPSTFMGYSVAYDDIDPYSDEVNSSSNFLEINFSVEQYKGEVITPYTTG